MKVHQIPLVVLTMLFPAFAVGQSKSLEAMKWHRRVLLVASPSADDPRVAAQRKMLASWQEGAADRDLSLVQISGSRVAGASDAAASLRQRYNLSPAAFQALLIGKDGHVALRQTKPIDSAMLERTIDAMPMRRAGER